MSFNFPNSPTNGQMYQPVGGYQYTFLDGVWRIVEPSNMFGTTKISSGMTTTAVPTFDVSFPTSGYQSLELIITDFSVSAAGGAMGLYFSWDGGATFPAGGTQYTFCAQSMRATPTTNTTAGNTFSAGHTSGTWPMLSVYENAWSKATARVWFPIVGASDFLSIQTQGTSTTTGDTTYFERGMYTSFGVAGPPSAGRITSYTGTILPGCKWQLNGVK